MTCGHVGCLRPFTEPARASPSSAHRSPRRPIHRNRRNPGPGATSMTSCCLPPMRNPARQPLPATNTSGTGKHDAQSMTRDISARARTSQSCRGNTQTLGNDPPSTNQAPEDPQRQATGAGGYNRSGERARHLSLLDRAARQWGRKDAQNWLICALHSTNVWAVAAPRQSRRPDLPKSSSR